MSLLTRLWETIEASTSPLPTALELAPQPLPLDLAATEPAPESSAITKEETDMHTADQNALVAIFNDLYGKVAATNAANAALQSRVSDLEAVTKTLTPTFDASQVTGYTPPPTPAASADGSASVQGDNATS